MTTTPITFSGLDRAEHCPAAYALPHERHDDDGARAGTAQHRYLQVLGTTGDEAEAILAVAPEYRQDLAELCTDGAPLGPEYQTEVVFALDVETLTAEVLHLDGHRRYPTPRTPTTIHGTLDVVGVTDEFLEVHDWKSRWDTTPTAARHNLQIHAGILAASLVHGARQSMRVGLWRLSDRAPVADVAEVDALTLGVVADRLREVVTAVHSADELVRIGGVPPTTEGTWCRYCPAFLHCPAKTARYEDALTRVDGANALESRIMRAISDDPAKARREYAEARRIIEIVGAAVKRYAVETGGWSMGDGRWYGQHAVTPRAMIDGATAFAVVEGMFGVDEAKAAVEMTTGKGRLKAAARVAVASGKAQTIVAAERLIETALREAGAWREEALCRVEEYARSDEVTP